MPQKHFTACLQLEIRSITCPGVWLCTNGRVSLIIDALGSQYETKILPSVFPLVYHEVFRFNRRIDGADSLESLKSALKKEYLHCELIQWSSDPMHDKGKILAKYDGKLSDLLYPSDIFYNNSIDLLMKASKNFPGIISPKINIVTKIQINETLTNESTFMNDKLLNRLRYNVTSQKNVKRQKTVCHSRNYHRLRKCGENKTDIEEDKNDRYKALLLSNDSCQHGCINHDRYNCSICLEYHKSFKNMSSTTEGDSVLTYKIPDEHLLSKNCEKIIGRDFIKNRLDNLLLDNDTLGERIKFRKFKEEMNQSCCNIENSCDNLQKKFDAICLRCLCEE